MDFTAEQVKNRHSISIGDTVIVSENKKFKLIDSTVMLDLDENCSVFLKLEWTLNGKTGVDTINSSNLKYWLNQD